MSQNVESTFTEFVEKQREGIELINCVSHLVFNSSVSLVLFRNDLQDQSLSEILRLHEENLVYSGIDISLTTKIAKELKSIGLKPATIDIGKLAMRVIEEKVEPFKLKHFLSVELVEFISPSHTMEAQDVILYGFGRIGRLVCRQLIKQAGQGQQLRLRAVVLRQVCAETLTKRASLLSKDSVHGDFESNIVVDTENLSLTINGQVVSFIAAPNPEGIDYEGYGINNAIVVDSTGAFRTKEALSRHLEAKGVDKAILTAPGDGYRNVVFGVNHQDLDLDSEEVFSAASCTTNAITPILYCIQNHFGVERGHIETIHAYTNDQNLQDNMHKKPRRGRSAAVNMVLTTTGAGKAVAKAIPELAGRLTSHAVRVPTPNGSLAIIKLTLSKKTSTAGLNKLIKDASLDGKLANQIHFSTETELVSTDIIGNNCCSVFDSNATIVDEDGRNVVIYVWYDNEHGYTMQVMRLTKYVMGVFRPVY